jgi:hypothetical protein
MNEIPSRPPLPSVSPENLRRLHETTLQTVAKGPNPVIAEMAREILANRVTLREAVTGLAYREAFAQAGERAMASLRGKTMDDLRKEAQSAPDEPTDDAGEPDTHRIKRNGNHAGDDEYFDQPIMASPDNEVIRTSPDTPPQRARWNRRRR